MDANVAVDTAAGCASVVGASLATSPTADEGTAPGIAPAVVEQSRLA